MEIIALLATLWLTLFGAAVILQRGQKFASWTWCQVKKPFTWLWKEYHKLILAFAAGILVGLAFAPQVYRFLQ